VNLPAFSGRTLQVISTGATFGSRLLVPWTGTLDGNTLLPDCSCP